MEPLAKTSKIQYRRNLPHIQREGSTYFVTFVTGDRWIIPEMVRTRVLDHCLHDHGTKAQFHAVVVMPDHVHLLLTPGLDATGQPYSLSEIIGSIKGASAHTINKALGRTGHVWQAESFDHVLRSDESLRAKADYVCANPVRRGLVVNEDEYPWLWREWPEDGE